MTHQHRCATCEHEWECLLQKCQVEKAVTVNKQGPYCDLCLHVEMARRYAKARGIVLEVNWP